MEKDELLKLVFDKVEELNGHAKTLDDNLTEMVALVTTLSGIIKGLERRICILEAKVNKNSPLMS